MNTDNSPVKISFSSKLLQIRATLYPEQMNQLLSAPVHHYQKVKKVMNREFSAGNLAGFEIYEQLLKIVWEKIRLSKSDQPINVVLAAGYPQMKGLRITSASKESKGLCKISITSPSQSTESWRPEWIELFTNMYLKEKGIRQKVHPAQIHAVWYRSVIYGETINQYQISPTLSSLRWREKQTHYKSDLARQQIDVIIGDMQFIEFSEEFLEGFFEDVHRQIAYQIPQLQKENTSNNFYRIFDDLISKTIMSAQNEPYILNINLPLIILGAIGFSPQTDYSFNFDFYSILLWELMGMKDFQSESAWIKKRAYWPLVTDKIEKTLATFVDLKMVSLAFSDSKTKQLVRSKEIIPSRYRVCGSDFEPFFQESLSLALKSIERIPQKRRFLQALTTAISEDHVSEIRSKIQNFNHDIISSIDNNNDDYEVHQLNLQFFPMTRRKKQMGQCKFKEKLSNFAMSECFNLLVREMFNLGNPSLNAEWIASRLYLPFTLKQINDSLEKLKKAKFIQFDPRNARYILPQKHIATEMEVTGKSVKQFHQSMIELSQQMMDLIPPERRFICTLTLLIKEDMTAAIRNKIYTLLMDIMNYESSHSVPDQVYQINVQLFPLTH